MIIGLANSKGGVGKSALAKNILVYLNDNNFPVALVDAERGAPTASLLNKFDSKLVTRPAETLDEIDDAVSDLKAEGFHVIIDAPGKEGDQVLTLCLLSDLVLIPMCVSEQDILQTVSIMKLVLRQRNRSSGLPEAAIVFTRTLKNDIAIPRFRKQMSKLGIPIADSQIREIVAIKRNISVMRDCKFLQDNGPANDFIGLVDEVIIPILTNKKIASNE